MKFLNLSWMTFISICFASPLFSATQDSLQNRFEIVGVIKNQKILHDNSIAVIKDTMKNKTVFLRAGQRLTDNVYIKQISRHRITLAAAGSSIYLVPDKFQGASFSHSRPSSARPALDGYPRRETSATTSTDYDGYDEGFNEDSAVQGYGQPPALEIPSRDTPDLENDPFFDETISDEDFIASPPVETELMDNFDD